MRRSTITSISARKPRAAAAASAAAAADAIDDQAEQQTTTTSTPRWRRPPARCSVSRRDTCVPQRRKPSRWSFDSALLYYGESDDRVQDVSAAITAQRDFGDERNSRPRPDRRHAHRRIGERRDRARPAADIHQPFRDAPCTRRRPARCRSTTHSSTRASRSTPAGRSRWRACTRCRPDSASPPSTTTRTSARTCRSPATSTSATPR